MSGSSGRSSASSGVLTNNGSILLNLDKYKNFIIKDIILHVIPLSLSKATGNLRTAVGIIKEFIPCITYPSLTHMAAQINLKNCNDILFIEYGEYFTKKSDLIKESKFASSSSFDKQPRKILDKFLYYYINDDGARITVITEDNIKEYYQTNDAYTFSNEEKELSDLNIPRLVTRIIASQHYGIEKLPDHFELKGSFNNFYRVECNIKNEITLDKFIMHFKNEKWLAKKYNVAFHNCQDFVCEIIHFLEATRRNEIDRIRIKEKLLLPNCVVNSFIWNEGLTRINVLGRIPIFGYFHDWYQYIKRDEALFDSNK